ncbi:hypothetical protein [Natrinema sp. CGMCC1.2065]|uniref:hypothetical protein n=1 Tax=Natrinema sp. CGMCC1.2065 TaxID=3445767 RepID=UPI003F49D566
MVCPRCETANHPADECPERHEEYQGLPSDHFDADAGIVCWVQDVDETWHASMYFEGTSHVTACGEILETPVADVRDDPRRLANVHTCDDCEAALEADKEETVPDGGEFERASKLRADGGQGPDDLVVLVCEPCDYETVVARGAIPATSCPDCQGDLEIDDSRTAHRCPNATDVNHVIVETGERCPLCQTVQQRTGVVADGGLEEVFRQETIVATDDGVAIGEDAVPDRGDRDV